MVASYLRQSLIDAAHWRGRPWVQVLWDMKAFYDQIDELKLLPAAERADFPLEVLVLVAQVHTPPRILTHEGGCRR